MTLSIDINGKPYKNFTSATVRLTLMAVTRGFSFTSTVDANSNFAIKIGDNVTIRADGIDVLDGFIERLEIDYDDMSHEIRVDGRSKLLDLVDSTVPTQFEIEGTSLDSICSSLLSSLEIEASVDNQAGSINDFKDEISSGEPGENAFNFLEKYSRKRQVILTNDGSNTLVLARAGTEKAPANLKNVRYANDNNILSANISIDHSKRFYYYLVKSQLNPLIAGITDDPEILANQEGEVLDEDIRKSRKMVLNAEESSDSFSAKDRATWEKNIRKGAAQKYSAKVVGNSINGKLWLPNTLVKVTDNFCQVDGELLIRDVEYNFDVYSGSTTKLTMIDKLSITLEIEQSQRAANSESFGDEYLA